tara:strand:- start:5986 stop:6987 length:1002 start_codon:yes stop_codon:yes gene_type:complete
LEFYEKYDYPFNILILDSSSDKYDHQIDIYINRQNILYKKYDSSIFFPQKINDGCKYIKTTFAVLCADDDFLIPNGIIESRNFLYDNGEYSSAHGLYFNHSNIEEAKKRGFSISPLSREITESTDETTGVSRIQTYLLGKLSNYPLYAVHRSKIFCSIWNETNKYVSDWGLSELFPCCISLAYGKMKTLPVFYSSREPNTFSWGDENRFKSMYSKKNIDLASKGISALLSRIDKIKTEEAYILIQKSFKKYLIRSKEKKIKASNSIFLFWNMLRRKIAIRTKIRTLLFNGFHPSIPKSYYEDYKKIKDSVLNANTSDEILNFSRQQYAKMNKI